MLGVTLCKPLPLDSKIFRLLICSSTCLFAVYVLEHGKRKGIEQKATFGLESIIFEQ